MTLSSRFWNSGRNVWLMARMICSSVKASAVGAKPSPEVRWLVAPRLVVRMMMQWRKSATWPMGR